MIADSLRRAVRDFWADGGDGAAGTLLAPAESVFRLAVRARNHRHDRLAPPATEIPVVSVGNIIAGGTGKTPVVRWLAEWLRRRGVPAAILTRGYGADEVALYRRWFGPASVFPGKDRMTSVRRAAGGGYAIALLDDGFQHRRLGRALDVLLVAAEDPRPVRLHPRGPYREPLSSARRASHILLTHRSAGPRRVDGWLRRMAEVAPHVPTSTVRLGATGWMDVAGAPAPPPRGDVLAVCSIARPQDFRAALRSRLPAARIDLEAFSDHHDYTEREATALVGAAGDRTLVCTEKDAVKLAAFPGVAERCVALGFGVDGEPPEPLAGALETMVAGVAR